MSPRGKGAPAHVSQISEFFTIQPSQRDHVPAARIALSVAIPLLVLLLVDRTDLAIYARNEPARARAAHQSWAGLWWCCA